MGKNKRSKVVLATIMAISVLASVLVLPAFAANENVIVGITSDPTISGAEPGVTATVPIIVSAVTDLGAGTLSITYNPSVCNVTDVTVGDLSTAVKNLGTPGLAIISVFDLGSEHTGDVTIANLKIKAIGSYGETSPLNITVTTLKTFGPPSATILAANISVSNGTFIVLGGPRPTPTTTPIYHGGGGGETPSIVTPTPTSTPVSSPSPYVTSSPTPTITQNPSLSPSPTATTPGFEVAFAIAGLLAVAYLFMKQRIK